MVIMENYSYEICRKTINVGKNEESFCGWCNSHLAVRTAKGIHFYEFAHNLETYDKKLDLVESFIGTPTSSVAKSIFDCKYVNYGLKNLEISKMLLDTAMWPHSEHLVQEMTSILSFEFSPPGLIRNKTCALAILSNIGNIELYTMGRYNWVSILSVSSLVKAHFKAMVSVKPQNFNNLKTLAHNLATCSICWAQNMMNGSCYLVTSQKSGILLFWLIQYSEEKATGKFCGKFELDFGEVVHMKWISKSENNFFLLCSNVLGQVMVLECQINDRNVTMINSHMLWTHQDRMIAKFSEHYMNGDRLLLFYNKHRHLVSQLLDENCKVIAQSVNNINDFRITSLAKNLSQYFVTTVNFKLYKIDFTTKNDVLNIAFNIIEFKDINLSMEVYNMTFSYNGVICALNALDRKIMHKKDPLQMEIIFIQAAPDNTVLDILVNNPSKLLTNAWDCIELLRYKIVKQKMLPALDYKALLAEGETDVYKLKIYLIILRIYLSLVSNIKLAKSSNIPENSVELIKDKILAIQANSNIKKYYHKHVEGISLTSFEKEAFVGSRNYLQFYNQKHKTMLTDMVSMDMLYLIKDDFKYACQCCDEEIINFSCQNQHLNLFCSLTFTPIESLEYLSCKFCNTLARIEMLPEKPLCVFCDYYLEHFHHSL